MMEAKAYAIQSPQTILHPNIIQACTDVHQAQGQLFRPNCVAMSINFGYKKKSQQ